MQNCILIEGEGGKGLDPRDWSVVTAGLEQSATAAEDSRCLRPAPVHLLSSLSLSLSPSLSRSESGCGKCRRLGERFPASFSRARLPCMPSLVLPARSGQIAPHCARLAENRRLTRLGGDYRHHMQRIHGALDATNFFPPRRLEDD